MSIWKKIKPNWTGALLTGAGYLMGGVPGAIIGGAIGTYTGNQDKIAKRKQNQANQWQAMQQNALARQNWDITNAYNDPKAQMQRLKDAGLNPNLVYGGGNVTGNSASALNANAVADYNVFNQADSVAKALPIMQGFANLRNTNTQNQLLNYQMGQTQAQTDSLLANTVYTNAQTAHMNLQDEVMRYNLKIARETGMPVGQVPSLFGLRANIADIGEKLYDSIPGFGLVRRAYDYFSKK